jgi:hypothetical protein
MKAVYSSEMLLSMFLTTGHHVSNKIIKGNILVRKYFQLLKFHFVTFRSNINVATKIQISVIRYVVPFDCYVEDKEGNEGN